MNWEEEEGKPQTTNMAHALMYDQKMERVDLFDQFVATILSKSGGAIFFLEPQCYYDQRLVAVQENSQQKYHNGCLYEGNSRHNACFIETKSRPAFNMLSKCRKTYVQISSAMFVIEG